MANPFFQFKQFTIYHDQCGMKVGTDGVLLGAYATPLLPSKDIRILDIGTGTGLVLLMLAQRYPNALLDGVEIDHAAFLQAQDNVQKTPWASRIQVLEGDFKNYSKESKSKYDLIVSNPPFFQDSLKAKSIDRTLARHTDSLPFEILLSNAKQLMLEEGKLVLILPFDHYDAIQEIAKHTGLALQRCLLIKGNPSQPVKRMILSFIHAGHPMAMQDTSVEELVIEEARHCYTEEYIHLTRDFYLKM